MSPLSREALAECRRYKELRPACPTEVPATDPEVGNRSSVNRVSGAYIFDAEWGAPYRNQVNERDRPPRFAHLVVMGGRVAAYSSFKPVEVMGERTWGERTGLLALAPPYPRGGVNGSHLLFRWTEGGAQYVVTLHAWEPLDQAQHALRQTVLSVP